MAEFQIYTEAKAKYVAGDRSWTATDEETREHFLNVMPPIYAPGMFACSEAWSHTPDGEPIYIWFRSGGPTGVEARFSTEREALC